MVDWLQPSETPGDGMETLGRNREPRTFDPLVAAKLLAWLGGLVLVLGIVAVVYLISQSSNRGGGLLFGGGAVGRVYTAVTILPSTLIATGVLWGVAALLWTRSTPKN